ncbi:MAG TPA: YihY/virulence factor BrkB family protein [Crenalkalicoccus sp.]|jgi:membrane protein|nr:YihY/virulence factor BrkB family protein [Crenalkalicoccus sp.]
MRYARKAWELVCATVVGYFEDDAPSRGAAIAYYTLFSLPPLLVIATAIAGLVFGEDAVQGAIAGELRGLLGPEGAEAVQALVASAGNRITGSIAAVVGVVTLLLTASGVFSELQSALNAIWRAAPPPGGTITVILRNRAIAFGLVAATGFLLLASLLASAAVAALATWTNRLLPGVPRMLALGNFTVSFLTVAALFAAIYKILPDRQLAWRDVGVGALVTAFLFTVGKSLIGWYIGSSAIASSYGAAGALMVVLLWIYYSAQIFLLGAEFTRVWAGLRRETPAAEAAAVPPPPRRRERRARASGDAAPLRLRAWHAATLLAAVVSAFRQRR